MAPFGPGANRLALDPHAPAERMSGIVAGRRAVSPPAATRLARSFGTTARFWIDPRSAYDLSPAVAEDCRSIEVEVRPRAVA